MSPSTRSLFPKSQFFKLQFCQRLLSAAQVMLLANCVNNATVTKLNPLTGHPDGANPGTDCCAGSGDGATKTSNSDGPTLHSPSQAAIDAAIAAPLIKYNRNFKGGAYTNGAWFGGASIVLAVASYTGNTSADARLFEQIRLTLTGTNEICANGGYPAQHELQVTGMFAIVRQTPRIWAQLSASEITKIDLLMKAALVSSAFVTGDNNPFVVAGTQQYTLDGDSNVNRGWNPNYREGMAGGLIAGLVYFGGPAAASAILQNYKHDEFVANLNSAGLSNLYQIFNWKVANPSSPAPTGAMIKNAVGNFKYFGIEPSNYGGIYSFLVNDTYGKNVMAGLNNGAGINGAGMLVAGAEAIPNLGALGMLKEFDAWDAEGARSSLIYAYDGFRPHQTNQLMLIIGGYWHKGSAEANAAVAKINVGNTDLWYKIEHGYVGYAHASSQGYDASFAEVHGFSYVRSLWEDVLKPYHFE